MQHSFNTYHIVIRACLQYVYMPLLRKELQEFVEEHNSHRIRKQRGKKTPQGIPEDLYNFPELKGMHTIWILGETLFTTDNYSLRYHYAKEFGNKL